MTAPLRGCYVPQASDGAIRRTRKNAAWGLCARRRGSRHAWTEIERSGTGAFGFDAARGTYVGLIDAGIVDPTKVVRIALENAVSVAGVLLLTEVTLTEVPEHTRETPQPAEME